MDAYRRGATSWAVILALLVSVILPIAPASAAADPDGACGPVLVARAALPTLDATAVPDTPDHCLRCHWLSLLASASAGLSALWVPHIAPTGRGADANADAVGLLSRGPSSPRGPPSRV